MNVVKSGSLSAVGRHLGFSPASVSRRINALEGTLGVRLLNRTSRKLTLTEAGAIYFEKAERVLNEIQDMHEVVSQLQRSPGGHLRVHSRLLVGTLVLAPALPRFLMAYPEIHVDLQMSNFDADLVGQNIDIDVRIGSLADSSLIARKLVSSERVLVATPEYLERMPPICVPADLGGHNCLTYRTNLGRSVWHFLDGGAQLSEVVVSGTLATDNGYSLLVWPSQAWGSRSYPTGL